MFNWFRRNKVDIAVDQAIADYKKTEEQRFRDYLAMEEAEKRKAAEAEAKRKSELDEAARRIETEKEAAIKNSDEPWIKVESSEVDSNGNIAITLDWNLAFTNYLRQRCNFNGDDDKIIHQWLAALYREMVTDGRNNALDILKHFPDTNELKNKEE